MGLFSVDLYGKETIMLEKQPGLFKRMLFIRDDLGWIKKAINKTADKNDKKELKILCGEIGDSSYSIIDYALRKGFKVRVISGPNPINNLFVDPNNIDLCLAKKRPEYHFTIIGSKYLYLENHHMPWKEHTSIGVIKPHLMDFYEEYFYKMRLN